MTALLDVVLIGAVAAIWWLAARRPSLPEGLAESAAITAVLVFGTLLSPQFVIWPLPFVAIAGAAGAKNVERWAGAVALLTLVGWILFDPNQAARGSSEVAILCRNAALAGLLIAAVLEIRRAPRAVAHATIA